MSSSHNARDRQPGQDDPPAGPSHAGHNKAAADAPPTQTNEPRRTPGSRHDRESHVGSGNQVQSRKGGH